jgi:hypothetical protein
MLPTPLELGPDVQDLRLAFIVDVSWVQFLQLIARHITQEHPMYLDLVENALVTYLCHRNAYPQTHDPNPWLTLSQFHDRIAFRMNEREFSPPLSQLLFDALPRVAFPGGVRSAQSPLQEGCRGEIITPDPIDTHHRALFMPTIDHANAIHTLPDPARLSDVLDRVDADLVRHRRHLGRVPVQIFPEDFGNELHLNAPEPPTHQIIRPYQEILNLLRFNHQLIRAYEERDGLHVTWDYVSRPVVYIYTMDSMFAIIAPLWNCYLTATDLHPLTQHDNPPLLISP